jgi:hypothetical protein
MIWKNIVAVVIGAVIYNLAARYAIALALAVPAPTWWGTADSGLSLYGWLQVTHAVGVLLLSVPFALAILALRLPNPVLVGLGIGLIGLAVPSAFEAAAYLSRASQHLLLSYALDTAKFAGTLPLLVWLFGKVSSKNSSKSTAAPKLV